MAHALEADPVNQLEEILECSVCLKPLKDPRTLPCFHSFCKVCLEGVVKTRRDQAPRGRPIRQFHCPSCREEFTLEPDKEVADMRPNHFICNLVQATAILNRETGVPCSNNCSKSLSVAYCVNCEKFLCASCLTGHNNYRGNDGHSVLTMEELSKPENRMKIKGKMYCKAHKDEPLKVYCETCDQLICRDCMDFKHAKENHSCLLVNDVANNYKELLDSSNKTMINALNESNELLTRITLTTERFDCAAKTAKANIVQRKEEMARKVLEMLDEHAQKRLNEVDQIHRDERAKLDTLRKDTEHYAKNIKRSVQLSKKLVDQGTEEEIISSQKMMLDNAKNLLTRRPEYFNAPIPEVELICTARTANEPASNEEISRLMANSLGAVRKQNKDIDPKSAVDTKTSKDNPCSISSFEFTKNITQDKRGHSCLYQKMSSVLKYLDEKKTVKVSGVSQLLCDLITKELQSDGNSVGYSCDVTRLYLCPNGKDYVLVQFAKDIPDESVIGNKLKIHGTELQVERWDAASESTEESVSKIWSTDEVPLTPENGNTTTKTPGGKGSKKSDEAPLTPENSHTKSAKAPGGKGSKKSDEAPLTPENSHTKSAKTPGGKGSKRSFGTEAQQEKMNERRSSSKDGGHNDDDRTSKGESATVPTEKLSCILGQNVKLVVYKGDLTQENVDAIVNPANARLQHGVVAAGAILKAGGKTIQDESDNIMKSRGERPLQPGAVEITSSGRLPCKFVIHAVGPIWGRNPENITRKCQLYTAVYNSLFLACQNGAKSISIPAIGSGLYKVPVEVCALVLFNAVVDFTSSNSGMSLEEIRFVNIDPSTNRTFVREMEKRIGDKTKREKMASHLTNNTKGHERATPNALSQVTFSKSDAGPDQKPVSAKVTYVADAHNPTSGHDKNTGSSNSAGTNPGGAKHGTNPGGAKPGANPGGATPRLSYSEATAGKKSTKDDSKPGADAKTSKDDECSICLSEFTKKKTLDKCGHSFCTDCIDQAFAIKKQCPLCSMVYGPLTGNQPKGYMNDSYQPTRLPGFGSCGTIVISYRFPSGKQGPEHPNPGRSYQGTSRTAYLPDNKEGKKVLRLLRKAFEQRLTFTIGRSSTTGAEGAITWNDIHHKTSMTGGPSGFGYPDPNYLRRVQEELAAKGITE